MPDTPNFEVFLRFAQLLALALQLQQCSAPVGGMSTKSGQPACTPICFSLPAVAYREARVRMCVHCQSLHARLRNSAATSM